MFLKTTASLMLILFFFLPFYADGALYTTGRYEHKDAETDIAILKSIHSRNPADLITLKRLIDLTFTLEYFDQTEKYCSLYLEVRKESEIAYIKIIAAASLGNFKDAAGQIDTFINDYKDELSSRDVAILGFRKNIYTKSTVTRGFPSGAKNTSWGTDCLLTTMISRDSLIAEYNYTEERHKFLEINGDSISSESKYPDYLTGLPSESINFVSLSDDGREVLASSRSGDTSEIYIRRYLPEKKSWSSWEKPDGLNPGRFNHYPNFINNDTVIFSSSDGADYDFYISKRDKSGEWLQAENVAGINTPLDEISIWVHPDGETIYFSSNGYEGMGGFDIYGARLIPKDGYFEISGIENITSANTFRNEKYPLFVTPSAGDAYFNFTIGKNTGIYRCSEIKFKPAPVFFYNANIVDDSTGTPINKASAVYKSQSTGYNLNRPVYSDGFTGTVLRKNLKYNITIIADGYEQFSKTLSLAANDTLVKNSLNDKIRLKRKTDKPEIKEYTTLITSIKLIDCEESKSLQVLKTLETGLNSNNAGKLKNIRSFTVCGDKTCALTDGKTVNADFVVFGTLTKIKQSGMKTLGDTGEDQYIAKRVMGASYILELKLLDTSSGKVIVTHKKTTMNTELLPGITKEFIKKAEASYTPRP